MEKRLGRTKALLSHVSEVWDVIHSRELESSRDALMKHVGVIASVLVEYESFKLWTSDFLITQDDPECPASLPHPPRDHLATGIGPSAVGLNAYIKQYRLLSTNLHRCCSLSMNQMAIS